MKRVFVVFLALMVVVAWTSFGYAQQSGGLPALQTDLQSTKVDLQNKITNLQGLVTGLQTQIDSLKSGGSGTTPDLTGIVWKGISIAGNNDIVGVPATWPDQMNLIYALGADRPCRFRADLVVSGSNFTGTTKSCHGPDSLIEGTIDSFCNVHFKTTSNIEFFGKITGQMLFGTLRDLGFPNPQWPDGFMSDDINGNCPGYGTNDNFPKARDGILIARSIIAGSDPPGNPGTPTIVPGCE